ncbi:MAG: TetR/AcrR family transcriptional regulator [Desulfomonile tiedjei]|nr:TetR/AcrR family transcriptional regulator [Desulfomonile tiedjei]
MKALFEDQILAVVSSTKAHKDTFAVAELLRILQDELGKEPLENFTREETVLIFVERATEALMASPIYSDALLREFYRRVLDIATAADIRRDALLEDLLFQSISRGSPADRPKRKKQKDVRQRIMEAALSEFSEKGYHATTIDSIAERAGIGKGTVYRYFKTKEALFSALKEDTITEFVELARQDLSREKDVLNIIESVIRIYLGFFEKNSAFFKVIVQEHRDFGREFSEKFINELILALPGLKRRCWQASRSGRLKQMNYFTVFFGIIGFLNGVIQKWLHDGGEASLLDQIDTIKEVLFYGFVIPSGETATKPNNLKVIS